MLGTFVILGLADLRLDRPRAFPSGHNLQQGRVPRETTDQNEPRHD